MQSRALPYKVLGTLGRWPQLQTVVVRAVLGTLMKHRPRLNGDSRKRTESTRVQLLVLPVVRYRKAGNVIGAGDAFTGSFVAARWPSLL